MKTVFSSRRYAVTVLLVLLCGLLLPEAQAQTYNFRTREASVIRTAQQIKDHNGFADTIVVRQDKWDEMAGNTSWSSNLKFKSVHAFVKFYVNHAYPTRIYNPYTFRLVYRVYGYGNMADTVNSYTMIRDTLTISYKPDSLASFQDIQYKKYSNFHKIVVVMENLYKITGASSSPVLQDLSTAGSFYDLNFNVEGSILVQPYHKRVLSGGNYVGVYGPSAPAVTIGKLTAVNDYLPVRWNLQGATLGGNLELTPVNYELEWTYIDNYKVNPATGAVTTIPASSLSFNFKDNATRVWLDTNYYQIPLIYQKGHIVYRVRMVRPDSLQYRYPVYGPWNLGESGTLSIVAGGSKFEVSNAHLNDSLNWQYTVSFAEQGKYKHVMSYYDGMLKNRQSITRFNSMPGKLIATEQVYDYEGRPSISVLPTPVTSAAFRYQYNLTLNSYSGLPYKASDFDYLSLSVCPNDSVLFPLASTSPSRLYYSPDNPDQAGFQKFVPDAGGYPFVQTVYSPGYDERVEKQGGAGDSLQIGYKHTVKNDYVSSDQADLNRLFGTEVGWSGFYRKTVSRDPNGQLSMSVTDYKGKTVASSMIGIPDTNIHAIVANENLADTAFYMEDHMVGTAQQIMGNKRILDKSFFNDAGGNNTSRYEFSFSPFPTFCPGKYLSVADRYDYSIFDECGTLIVDTGAQLGTTGVTTNPAAINYPSFTLPFYMEKGKHSLHKELTVNTDEVKKAVDDFMALSAGENCMKTEPWFIKESVLSKEFPCPENYINMDCNTCAGKKYEMMQELWPNKDSVYVKRKYGIYDKNTGTVLGNDNSIFTLLCGPSSGGLWDIEVTDGSVRSVIGGNFSGNEGAPYILGGGNFGHGPEFDGFVLSGSDTLSCHYRYQDTCLVQLPASITRFGQTYTNLQSLPVDTFIYIFNDTIAEALLPLHPEYCSLLECVDDVYEKKIRSIPDATVAAALDLLYLQDIITADPLYAAMQAQPSAYPNAYDTLAYSINGIMSLDTMALLQAYCNCSDSIMMAECYYNMFGNYIGSGTMLNNYVKERYFSMIRNLYLGNRKRYLFNLDPALSALGGCSVCQEVRMDLVPLPVFMNTFGPGGGQLTGPGSFLGAVGSVSPGSVGAVTSITNYINTISSLNLDTLQAYSDSAVTLYTNTNTLLCNGPIDQIIQQLVNCADSITLVGVRNSLAYLCTNGQVTTAGYTPQQIRKALTDNGIALGDLCNPYLVNYDGNMSLPAGMPSGPFTCNNLGFYNDATITMNGNPLLALKNIGTSYSISLSGANQFEAAISAELSGAGSCTVYAAYNSPLKLYTLTFTNGSQQVNFYFKSGSQGVCTNAFTQNPGETLSLNIGCVNDIYGGFASGYIGKYSFAATVNHTTGSATTSCWLPGWNDAVYMNNEGINPIGECVPCTQMNDLYKEFIDTLYNYGISAVNHPYSGRMLRNFMNFRLKKVYTNDQYWNFIETCRMVENNAQLFKSTGQIAILSFDTTLRNQFFAELAAFDSTIVLQPLLWVNQGQVDNLYIDFNTIPQGKYKIIRDFILNFDTAQAEFYVLPIEGAFSGTVGLLITDTLTNLDPSGVIGGVPTGFNFGYTTTVNVWNGNTFVSGYMYDIGFNSGDISDYYNSVKDLPGIFGNNNISAQYFFSIDDLDDLEQYGLPEKEAYVNYVYGFQGLPPSAVLDTLQAHVIESGISILNGKQVSYGHPAAPGNIQNLYIGDPATATNGTRYAKLQYILNTVKSHFYSTTGKNTIFFTGANTVNILPNNQLTAFRCGDTAFWYRHFGDGDTLFNVFVRVPAYLDTAQLSGYELQSYGYNLGEGNSRSFHLNLTSSALPALPLNINGFTDFTVAHNEVLNDVLLAHTVADPIPIADTVVNCERNLLNAAIYQGKVKYKMYVDSIREKLSADFFAYVMNGGITEKLFVGYKNQRFNYTLYTYDRAGNLTITIPPSGVLPILPGSLVNVDSFRLNNNMIWPYWSKPSIFFYNSFNQVSQSNTPDGGITQYFYDAAGRCIFSQNSKQQATGHMTYTLYDKQGRIIETGQARLSCTPYFYPFFSPDIPVNYTCSYYDAWESKKTPYPIVVHGLKYIPHEAVIDYVRALPREEVVLTHYDEPAVALNNGMSPQENLRKRVAAIKYFEFLQPTDASFANYDYAMHFSYDITGNVKTLTRDYPALAISRQQFKRIDYDYDVISGKVNLLSYNRSYADQFFQRYAYDGDNRITKVETSNDGYIWQRDAEYQYYQHGPLARMSLGELRVQGVDYAYTIQGWLKAVNGDLLDSLKDMGLDGKSSSNSIHAHDAAALSLDYFKGDYRPIGGAAVTHIAPQGKSMYNGNIPRATTSISPFPDLASTYTYDQLNRIIKAGYQDMNRSNAQLSNTANYYSKYAYDPDGNIKKLVRNGNQPGNLLMDSLNYNYVLNAGINNQLNNIVDYAADNYSNDIRHNTNSIIAKYLYDATGNVVKDLVSGQDTIQWNHYNKVTLTSKDTLGNGLHFAYDGAGNRYLKTVVQTSGDTTVEKSDYYVRDAQGNILAVYNTESKLMMTRREWIEYVSTTMMTQVTRRQFLEELIGPFFAQEGRFKAHEIGLVASNSDFISSLLIAQPVSFFVRNNKAVRNNIMAHTGSYADFYTAIADYTQNTGQPLLGSAIFNAMWNNYFSLDNMMTVAFSSADIVMKERIVGLFCPADTLVIETVERLFGVGTFNDILTYFPDTCATIEAIVNQSLYTEPEAFLSIFSATGKEPAYQNQYFNFVNAFASDMEIMSYPAFTEMGTGVLIPYYQASLNYYANDSLLADFMDNWSHARDVLNGTNSSQALMEVVYDKDNLSFLEQMVDNVYGGNLGVVYDALAAVDWLTLPHYLRRWEEVTVITPVLHTIYENVLNNQRIFLSSHHLYGSSRLGTKDYLAGQYYLSWDYSGPTPVVDTTTLLARRPWYSMEYNDNVSGLALAPWAMTDLSAYLVSHQIGQKQYELTNHLGNVQTTVTDLPVPQGEHDIVYHSPALASAYDYYPFGMLMPDRYVSDTSQQCVTLTQTKWVTTWVDSCWDWASWVWPGYQVVGSGTAMRVSTGIRVVASGTNDVVSFSLAGVPHIEQELSVQVYVKTGNCIVEAVEEVNGKWNSMGSQLLQVGRNVLRFTPTQNTFQVRFTNGNLIIERMCTKVPSLSQQSMLVDVCDDDGDRYRFGFNGQEKVNEWAGIGNFMDYTWRGYDTRVARFISRDPLARKFPYYTPYQFAGNTPIQAIDLDGREELHYTSKTWRDGDGNIQVDLKMSTEINALGHGSNGIWMTDINEIEGFERDWYIPDVIIEGTRIYKDTDPRSGFEKSSERMLVWMFTPVMNQVEKFDEQMRTAEYVGFRFKYAYEDRSNSLKGAIGVQSSSESNYQFVGSNGFERKGGLTSKSPSIGGKLQLGFYWKHKDNSFKTNFGTVDGKLQGYSKISFGPFAVEKNQDGTSEFTITLGKNAFSKTPKADAEIGAKATTEKKWSSPVYNMR